jgi:aspartyl/asparaginyl-tRNA synthetase
MRNKFCVVCVVGFVSRSPLTVPQVEVKDVVAHVGKRVRLTGWVHSLRSQGAFCLTLYLLIYLMSNTHSLLLNRQRYVPRDP